MDYYIVRIYWREKGDPDSLVGTIEEASSAERKSFRSPDELWNLLGGFGAGIQRDKGKGIKCDMETR